MGKTRVLKVFRVITRLNTGGPAQHAVYLTSGLNDGVFESQLLAGTTERHEGDMSFLAQNLAVPLIQIEGLSNGSGILGDIEAFWSIFWILKREKPDLVHLHLLKARFLGGIAAKLAGVPIIVETLHGNLFSEYFGKMKTAAILVVERLLGWFIVDKIIAISETQRMELLQFKICQEKKIEVILLGLNLERFLGSSALSGKLRKELEVSPKTILISAIGRQVPIKGLSHLLEAIHRMTRTTKYDFCLLMIGDGVMRRELEITTRGLQIENRVRFLGWRYDLENIYADVDIAVLSSLNEGTPVSLIEAMCAGKAVVATRVGGVQDLIDDGRTGLLVPPKDPEAMANAILRLFSDKSLRDRLGAQAKTSVYPKYDVSRLTRDVRSFYLNLVPS